MFIFSQRVYLADICDEWLIRNGIARNTLGTITFMNSRGLLDKAKVNELLKVAGAPTVALPQEMAAKPQTVGDQLRAKSNAGIAQEIAACAVEAIVSVMELLNVSISEEDRKRYIEGATMDYLARLDSPAVKEDDKT